MRKAEGVKQKVKIKLSAAAPAALLDYLLQNAGSTWLARCQDLASCPRVAGPPGPSRIKDIHTPSIQSLVCPHDTFILVTSDSLRSPHSEVL